MRRTIDREHPLGASPTHPGTTPRCLPAAAAIPSSYRSAIDHAVKPGPLKALKSFATALDLPLDDLMSPPRAVPGPRVLFHRDSGRLPRPPSPAAPLGAHPTLHESAPFYCADS